MADTVGVSPELIDSIEAGKFWLGLGLLRMIAQRGYGVSLLDLLGEYANSEDYAKSRLADVTRAAKGLFACEYYYRLRLPEPEKGAAPQPDPPGPLFCGGDGASFVWGMPFHVLKNQPMVTDYLELAPRRRRLGRGSTPGEAHTGVEVVHIVHGSVRVSIQIPKNGEYDEKLVVAGEAIHFHSKNRHWITNNDDNAVALLAITRLPE